MAKSGGAALTGNKGAGNKGKGGGGNKGGGGAGKGKGGGGNKNAPRNNPFVAPGIRAHSALLHPGATLEGKSLLNAAQGLAKTQTAGPLADLAKQIATNNAQAKAAQQLAGGYFNQFGQFTQAGAQQAQQIGNQLNSQLAALNQSEQSQLNNIGNQGHLLLAAYTPQGQPGAAPTTSSASQQALASEMARQQGLAAQASGAVQQYGAQQAAAGSTLAANQLGIGQLQGQQAIKGIAQANALTNVPLQQKRADLVAGRGAQLATDIGNLRQQEITNRITRAGLGIQKMNAQTSAQQAKTSAFSAQTSRLSALASANLRAQGLKITQSHDLAEQQEAIARINEEAASQAGSLAERTRHDQATEANTAMANNLRAAAQHNGQWKPLTPFENNEQQRNIDQMLSLIQHFQKSGLKEPQIRQRLQAGKLTKGFPAQSAALVQAAYELKGWGHLTPNIAQALHNMGIHNLTFRGKPVRIKQPPRAANAQDIANAGF